MNSSSVPVTVNDVSSNVSPKKGRRTLFLCLTLWVAEYKIKRKGIGGNTMKVKKKVWFGCILLVLLCMLPVSAQAATKAKKGVYQKTYTPNASFRVVYKPCDALIVTKISGKKISFVVEHSGVNGSPLYQTNTITATLKNNKVSKFKWKDTWGNSGTGSIKFAGKKATITMKTKKMASINRWGWWTKKTLSFKRKATAREKKYYSNLKV